MHEYIGNEIKTIKHAKSYLKCNALFGQHNNTTAKEISDALEAKYMSEDVTSKKFLPAKSFLINSW